MDGPDEVASILMGWAIQDMKYPGHWDQDQVTWSFYPLALQCFISDAIPVFWAYFVVVVLALPKLQVGTNHQIIDNRSISHGATDKKMDG